MTPPSKIQQLWELFIQSEHSSYEKSTWLDVFLAEFLAQVHEGKSVEDILLVGGVATLIGCELLTDVHQICSQPGDGEDLAPLCHYLLHGRGWRSLAVLHCLGVQNLSCGRELASLLISLYPVCLQKPMKNKKEVKAQNPYIPKKPATNIEDVFRIRTPLKNKFRLPSFTHNYNLCPPSRAEFHRSFSNTSTGRLRRSKTVVSTDGTKGNTEGATSESEHLEEDLDTLPSKASTLKIRLDPMDFDYFTSVVRSEDEARLDSHNYTPLKRGGRDSKEERKIPDDFKDERVLRVLTSEICSYEFFQLVIHLLQSLCTSEINVASDNAHQIAVQAINFSLENLCSLQFGSAPTEPFTSTEVAELKSAMTQLLLAALEKILLYSDVTMTVIRNGMLPVLLKVLEDAICKISAAAKNAEEECVLGDAIISNLQSTKAVSETEACKIQEFIFGCMYGIITFLYCLLLQRCTVDKFRDFLELFQLFAESHGGRLVEKTITAIISLPHVNSQISISRAKKVIDLTGQLIAALKKVRCEIIHSHQCRRTRHKQCISTAALETHHHLDLFGAVYSTCIVAANPHHACCIASLFMVLVRLLNSNNLQIESRVIKVMMMCGTCCCFPVRSLIAPLLEIVKKNGSQCRHLVFALLERTIYSELGAIATADNKISCVICYKSTLISKSISTDYSAEESFEAGQKGRIAKEYQVSSKLGDADKLSLVTSFEVPSARNPWSCLELFQDLLQSSDIKLCHDITSHLLKVSPRCTPHVKQELLFNVFYPTFCVAKTQFLLTDDDVSKFNVLSCLSIFSSLLGSITFADYFISQGGLNHILDLISLPVFSKLCCSVLEMIAIVEIWKLESEAKVHNGSESHVCDLKQLPSLNMLQNAMEASSRRLLVIFDKYTNSQSAGISNGSSTPVNTTSGTELDDNKPSQETTEDSDGLDNENCNINSEDTKSMLESLNESDVDVNKNAVDSSNTNDAMPGVILTKEDRDTYCQLLPTLCVFWRSCANLVVSSPSFRAHLQRQPVAEDAGHLLLCALNRVVQGNFFMGNKEQVMNHISESNLHMKLIEATLTVSLATPRAVKAQLEVLPDTSSAPCDIVIANLRSILLRSDLTCNVNVRQLCEVLLRCAVAECCQEQVMPPNRKPKLPALFVSTTWDESLSDADEDLDTTELSNDCSSLDDTYITADEGYEADIELLDGGIPVYAATASVADDCSSLGSPVGVAGSAWSEYGRNHNIVQPSLCTLAIDFLIHLNNRYLETCSCEHDNEPEINGNVPMWSELPNEAMHLQNLVHCIQRLVALCRDNPQNCITLAKNGVIEKLLDGFGTFLKILNPNYTELQSAVLELVTLLARYSISPQELSVYLNFFKANNPPLEALLTPLTSLVMTSKPQPNYILCFPVEATLATVEEVESIESKLLGGSPGTQEGKNLSQGSSGLRLSPTLSSPIGEDIAGNLAATLHSKHTEAGLVSAWSTCAVALPINTDLGWGMWMNGFSIGLWLRLERGSNAGGATLVHTPSYPSSLLSDSASGSLSDWGLTSDHWAKDGSMQNASGVKPVSSGSVLHMFSIGYENLMLEVWADPCSDTLTLKWMRPDWKSNEVLCESTVENCLAVGQWHHLAVNVKDYVQNKKIVIEVLLLIDGWREVKVLMTYSGLLVRKLRPVCLLLGHSVVPGAAKPVGSWYLGSVMLFRCPVFTRERAIYLVGLGPNYTNLTDCEVDRVSPNFTSVFGPKTLSPGIDWEMILDGKKGNLKELQDNLLLTYSAQNPHIVNVYPQVMTNPGGQPGFRVVAVEQRASQQLPLPARPILLATPNSQQYHGLVAAASILGGTPVFLFLLARVVELKASQQAQAKALFLLLKLVQADSELFAQFVSQDCHKLLLKVLSSSRCIAGHHMLKAVLDTCCDKPVLQYHPGTRKFHIACQSDAIIVNSFLLSTIVGSWRDWERAGEEQLFYEGGGVLGTLFRSLHVLLRDDHPFREFNATQLNRVRMVEALLLFCKERFLYEEALQLHVSVCCSLVELIRSLMGAPPEFSHIVAVTDFLVLLHQASATYVTHVRPSFYFLLSSQPPNVPTNLTNMPRSTRKETGLSLEKAGGFQIEGDTKLKSSTTKIFVNDLKEKETKNNFAQPVDPQKLNKALTNLQIQQCSGEGHGDNEASAPGQRTDSNSDVPVDSNKVDELTMDSGIACSFKENQNPSEQELIRSSTDIANQPNIMGLPYTDSVDNKIKLGGGSFSSSTSEVIHEEKEKVKDDLQIVPKKEVEEHEDIEKFTTETGDDVTTRIWPEESPTPTQVSFDSSTVVGEGEKWLGSNSGRGSSQSLVVEGLLLLLRDTLLVLPDNMAHQVLNHVVKAEALLVMANHADPRVRTAVVKVLSAYLQRSTDEEINKFLKIKGFYQLANQLSLFPASLELVEACVALVTRCSVSLEEQAEISLLTNLTFLQANSFPPLLALLPRCVHDTALTHNLIIFLREVFTKSLKSQSLRTLLDCGLLESLEKTIIAVAHMPPEPSDLCGISEQDLLLGDVQVFLMTIVGQVLRTPGAHHMQVINDLQLQLSYLERTERSNCGVHATCVTALRETQCVILEGSLDILQDKIASVQSFGSKLKNPTSFFSSDQLYHSSCEPPKLEHGQPSSAHQIYSSTSSGGSAVGKASTGVQSKEVPRSELNDRLKNIIVKSVDFLTNVELVGGRSPVTNAIEHNFSRRLLASLLQGLRTVLEKRGASQRTVWSQVMWAARDTLRVQSARLLVWLLSPAQPVKLRMFCVHSLRGEQRCKELVSAMLHTHSQMEQKFVFFLWELMNSTENLLAPADLRVCEELKDQLETWGIGGNTEQCSWQDEVRLLMEELERQPKIWEKHNESATLRSVYKFEGLMKTVAEAAMSITRLVVEAQNSERKVFMEHIKLAYSENVQIRIKWQKIVQQLTHERAVWFFSESYPQSWQLDATEGPARVRNRLQRCHLGIQSKYLMSSSQQKSSDLAKNEDPLSYLFEQDKQSSTSTVLIERLHTNEKIQHMCPARVITPANEVPGELLIGESCLYFVADDSILGTDLSEVTAGSLDVSSTAWQFENVKEIHNRRFQLQERALEIFLMNGKTYLVAFQSVKERDTFVWELSQCHLPNRVVGDNLSDVVQMWREGLITNWEYLTQLNKMAGRSFNDLMQYPVFPFVLSDYTSSTLNLHDPKAYRNFKKPMAVQDKKNEQHYINNYNYLKQELQESQHLVSLNQEPYHYGSHYSNSGTVLHFLVRLPPFTRMFLTYQDNNFDLPDRTFHSLYTTWRLASSDSTTDVKELIPEFFFLSEFLLNSEGFNFGIRQNGERVHHVSLPPWCDGDPRRFILVHRQALESDFVRENLPHWIDLVFGYKQTGKMAVDAINVFHPATYYGFNVETIKDPLERTAWETMVRTYGQTPRQLFRSAHPMVVQSLSSHTSVQSMRTVITGVKGLVWGSYVGSPSDPEPVVVWKHQHRTPVASLVPLLTNDVFGLAPQTSLLLCYSKEKGLSMINTTSVLGAALVTWGHSDSIIRAKLKKEQPPWPVVKSGGLDPICICASVPDCNQLWLGHCSGKLVVFEYKFDPGKGVLDFRSDPVTLLGHSSAITSLCICRSFSVVASGSQDSSTILWDLNNLSYVRSVPKVGSPVNLVCISETMGDVATVCHSSSSSTLRLYTINTSLVGSVNSPIPITALCFSSAPEGISVNVIATGLANGAVSLTYSYDSQHLYASAADGIVIIWEGAGAKGVSRTPKFLNLTSLSIINFSIKTAISNTPNTSIKKEYSIIFDFCEACENINLLKLYCIWKEIVLNIWLWFH
ncbi:Neurobeachin [Gryllus bimaculatus]|nr:Neurobeachin [Gryllus bimaculatus]